MRTIKFRRELLTTVRILNCLHHPLNRLITHQTNLIPNPSDRPTLSNTRESLGALGVPPVRRTIQRAHRKLPSSVLSREQLVSHLEVFDVAGT